jgi:hypothetical protein
MALRRLLLVPLCSALFLAACDRTPSDPLDPRGDLAVVLNGDGSGAYTLPGLLHASVHRVYNEHGPAAARALVADLRRLQQDARRAMVGGDREAVDAGLAAVQLAEIDIILRVFGEAVVDRAIAGVVLEAARMQRTVDEAAAAGRDVHRSRERLSRVRELIGQAETAHAAHRPADALHAATRAAASAEVIRNTLADAGRLPALAELFDLAISRATAEHGTAATTQFLSAHSALRLSADEAVHSRDRDRVQQALEAVRAEEIRLVLAVLGPESVQQLVESVSRGVADAGTALRDSRRDVSRLERMVATARDMNVRARSALAHADAHLALDLASHAAGLVNAARMTLSTQ